MQASLNLRRLVQSPYFCERRAPNARMENVEFGIMRLNNVNRRRCCAAACRRIPPSSAENICTKTQSVCAGAGLPATRYFRSPASVISQPLARRIVRSAALSLCSHSFVCLMTSLRGLLALDSRSQNGRTFRPSRVFKGAPSKVHDWQFLS